MQNKRVRLDGSRMTKEEQDVSNVETVRGIHGLSLRREAIGTEAAEQIAQALRSELWATWQHWRPFSRQDFGWEYNIGSRNVSPTTPIPDELRALFPGLRDAGWQGPDPTQIIVTRYPQGGSLGAHIDSPVFGGEIAGLSLEAEWPIVYSRRRQGAREIVPLPVRSAYVMRGPARTAWFHQIPPNYSAERISLTFRTLVDEPGDLRRP